MANKDNGLKMEKANPVKTDSSKVVSDPFDEDEHKMFSLMIVKNEASFVRIEEDGRSKVNCITNTVSSSYLSKLRDRKEN